VHAVRLRPQCLFLRRWLWLWLRRLLVRRRPLMAGGSAQDQLNAGADKANELGAKAAEDYLRNGEGRGK
jgi:hypothetical protein